MSDMQELGALWKKRSERTGNEFYSGDLQLPGGEKVKVIAFDNDRKTKDSHPDIRIYLAEDRGGNSGGNRGGGSSTYQKPAAPSRSAPATPAPAAIEYPTEEIDPDDIPF